MDVSSGLIFLTWSQVSRLCRPGLEDKTPPKEPPPKQLGSWLGLSPLCNQNTANVIYGWPFIGSAVFGSC